VTNISATALTLCMYRSAGPRRGNAQRNNSTRKWADRGLVLPGRAEVQASTESGQPSADVAELERPALASGGKDRHGRRTLRKLGMNIRDE
jgi:hypothetical protein